MRPLLVAIIGLVLVGFCLVSTAFGFLLDRGAGAPLDCASFSEHPTERWVTLEGCVLDFQDAVLSDASGLTLERLRDRREGLWSSLPAADVTWASMLVPVKTPENSARPARLVFVLADRDVIGWANSLEGATGDARAQISRRSGLLDRLANPAQLVALASRDAQADLVQRRLGREAAAGLFLLRPGTPPPPEVPVLALVLGALGAGALVWSLAAFNRRGHARERTALEDADAPDLRDVEVGLGALDQLREEERRERPK